MVYKGSILNKDSPHMFLRNWYKKLDSALINSDNLLYLSAAMSKKDKEDVL